MSRGLFISLEGGEGAGKSSLLDRLEPWLARTGKEVVRTREPGGSSLGQALRRILLDVASKDLTPKAELFLYLADRAQHVATVIRPALMRGAIVLCDRYADSTIVYQGYGRGLEVPALYALNQTAVEDLWPHRTLLLDLDPATGLGRALARNKTLGASAAEGRFEAEAMAFHTLVRQGFLDWANQHPQRFRLLDAAKDQDAVFAAAKTALEDLV